MERQVDVWNGKQNPVIRNCFSNLAKMFGSIHDDFAMLLYRAHPKLNEETKNPMQRERKSIDKSIYIPPKSKNTTVLAIGMHRQQNTRC